MGKYIWSIPGIAVFFYAVTVLFQYGYLTYFNIPAGFIRGSIADNIVFAHDLIRMGLAILALLRWWRIIILLLVLLCTLSFLQRYKTVAALTLVFIAYGFFNFGTFSAQNQMAFFMPSSGCPAIGPEKRYVAVSVSDGKAILVSIDDNRHLKPGFMVEDMSELPCGLELRNIGQIEK